MSNTNDERILLLKKQIEEKKDKLGKISRFLPVTNCLLTVSGVAHNINALSKENLTILLVQLNSYSLSAKDLNLDNVVISSYSLDDWITDLKAKLDYLSRKDEERMLKAMEEKLGKLLSDGKKVELEINEIASLLE